MTVRAVILGLLGAAFVCGVTYFNDHVMQQTMFVGNSMPYSVYGGLILFLLAINPVILLAGGRRSPVAAGAVAGLLAGVVTALVGGLAAGAAGGWTPALLTALTAGVLVGSSTGLLAAFGRGAILPGQVCGLVAAVAGGLAGGLPTGLAAGSIAGVLTGLVSAVVAGLAAGRRPLTAKEFAVVLCLTLAACSIPGSGLMRTMTNALMMPHHMARTRPGWESEEVIEMAPEEMLAGTGARLRADDILDPRGLCLRMTSDGEGAGDSRRLGRRIWGLFSEAEREAIREAARTALAPTEEPCRRAAVRALNGILGRRDLYSREILEGVTLPAEADRILDREVRLSLAEGEEVAPPERPLPDRIESLADGDIRKLNRYLIDSAWPGAIYAHAQRRDDEIKGFVLGMDQLRGRVSLGEIPWSAWTRTLAFWIPLVLLMWIGMIALAVVVHRQWSNYEQLSYPVTRFANSLLPAEGEARGGVFRSRLFWLATATILVIHLTNYAYVWKPNSLVRIPTQFDFRSLTQLFPTLRRGGASWRVFRLRTYFTVVAVAYFVASDVSLSLGIGPIIYCYVAGLLAGYGVSVGGGGFYAANLSKMWVAGAYFGILVMILYTGRHYYSNVFRRAVFLRAREEVGNEAVWGARVFAVCAALFTVDLTLAGLDWQFAVFYTLAAVVMFLVMGRIIAETGLFFIQPIWYPGVMLVGFLGVRAVGPSTALFMFLVSSVLLIDPREALMPFVVNSFKLLEARKVRLGRTAIWTGAAVILGLAVAVPATLMFQYGAGTGRVDSWATEAVPRFAFDQTVQIKQRLKAQDALSEAESVSGWSRLAHVNPEGKAVIGFCAGLAAVLAFSAARLRLPWWPLHPILFLVWSRYAGYMFCFSFLLGWLIKTLVTKYGGEKVYQKLKPVFFGLIAGDMLGGVIPSVIGAVYYLLTDEVPKSFQVMPH